MDTCHPITTTTRRKSGKVAESELQIQIALSSWIAGWLPNHYAALKPPRGHGNYGL